MSDYPVTVASHAVSVSFCNAYSPGPRNGWTPRFASPTGLTNTSVQTRRFFAAVPSDDTDQAALHRFRIRGKELRYVMELLGGAFPDSFRTQLYPMVEEIQDRLGEINDLATAIARLRKKIKEVSVRRDTASWRQLLAKEQAQLDQTRQDFWKWCGARRYQELRGRFRMALAVSV